MVCLHKIENDRPLSPLEIRFKMEHKGGRNKIIDHQKQCETMLDSIYEQGLQEKFCKAEQYCFGAQGQAETSLKNIGFGVK